MKALNEIVTTKLATMIDDGSIEKMIEDRLEKLMQETVNSAIRLHATFGSTLRDAIEESIGTSLSKITFPEYNHFLTQMLTEKYGQAIDKHASSLLEKVLQDELNPVPTEMTAQEIMDEIENCWSEFAHDNRNVIEFEWRQTETAIYMTAKHPEYDFESLKISFFNHGETNCQYHIGYITEDDKRISGSISGATRAMGLAGYFYKLYCRQTKITGLQDVYGENIYVDG